MTLQETNLARKLILDELFDLSLYKGLRERATGSLAAMLDELIPVETRHHAFWQDLYGIKIERLDQGRRFRLFLLLFLCRIFGASMAYLVLEAIEVYGINKYLQVWKYFENTPSAPQVRAILEDEFRHEDAVVSVEDRRIDPERVRNIFLGFNDGLVEFSGAVGGFFAAFQDTRSVLVASLTGAAAGAFSMAVGVYASSGSEKEMQAAAAEKERFLTGKTPETKGMAHPLRSAVVVGVSYMFGAMVPVLPVALGAHNVVYSWVFGALAMVLVTAVLSFLSGTSVLARVRTNLTVVVMAVGAAFLVGVLVKVVASTTL